MSCNRRTSRIYSARRCGMSRAYEVGLSFAAAWRVSELDKPRSGRVSSVTLAESDKRRRTQGFVGDFTGLGSSGKVSRSFETSKNSDMEFH